MQHVTVLHSLSMFDIKNYQGKGENAETIYDQIRKVERIITPNSHRVRSSTRKSSVPLAIDPLGSVASTTIEPGLWKGA